MKHTFGLKILIFFLHYQGIPSSNLENELLPQVGTKVVGGQPIEISQAKYQVSLRTKSVEQRGYGFGYICGGSVVSQRLIITAGHCMVKSSIVYHPSELTLVMGTKYRFRSDRNTLQYDVQEIIVHPNYNDDTLENDIAAMFINGYIPWNWKTVTAIPLNRLMLAEDTPCLVTGWGRMSNDEYPSILQAANVPIIDSFTCQKAYGLISIDMLCAGYMIGGIDACDGDSGGPLMCGGMLTGIVSKGYECGEPLFPGIYHNISNSYDWIRAINASFDYDHYGEGDHSAVVGIGKRSRLALFSSLLLMSFFNPLKKVLKKFTFLCTGIVGM